MDETKLRAEFEAWVMRTVTDVTLADLERDGEIYEWDRLNMAFAAWKASREALAVEWPDRFAYTDPDCAGAVLLDCRAAIHAAGIRTK